MATVPPLVRKLRIALSLLEDLALESPRVRLARCLINLVEGYGDAPDFERSGVGRVFAQDEFSAATG